MNRFRPGGAEPYPFLRSGFGAFLDFGYLHRPPLLDRTVARLDDREGAQIVSAAHRGLALTGNGVHQIGHWSLECIRKPGFLPARCNPHTGFCSPGERQRAWAAIRILGPAERSLGQTLGAFNAPLDIWFEIIFLAPRPGPDVVPCGGSHTVVVFQDVETDAVFMGK